MTILKIITAPIWVPCKILWMFSKFVAFVMVVLLIAIVVALLVYF